MKDSKPVQETSNLPTAETTQQRKPNFFDRKRFVDYEQNEDSENQEKSKD
jgi:hypothetical protein